MFRAFFITLSESKFLRGIAERSRAGQRVSARFVAGLTLPDVVVATKALNAAGMKVTMDRLGESVGNADQARAAAGDYMKLLDAIQQEKLDANVSVKLTGIGFDVDKPLTQKLVEDMTARAASIDSFVRVDMEGSPYTQLTLDLVHAVHARPESKGAVGTVIQSYLYRSEKDVQELCAKGIRIRLCKGAYKEPASVAFQAKSDVDANYVKLMKIMLKSGVFHGIATHDEAMIDATIRFARDEKIDASKFEFQMLYGIRRDLQEKLVKEGWGVRVYVPFGQEWYPYFMRRLAERPANALFVFKNFFRR
ncbi:MAG: proline dehydrogenase family protein [Thermoanaerobaculia bacterium]|nr:proline dehydrogenase family protein [Thermoanaerobaculia bacterium]